MSITDSDGIEADLLIRIREGDPSVDLAAVLCHERFLVRCTAARSALMTPALLAIALADPHGRVQSDAAANPNLDENQMWFLIHCDDSALREAFARNPALPASSLEILLRDPSAVVRQAAVRHPKMTAKRLEEMSNDPHEFVRMTVPDNPNVSIETVLRLFGDRHRMVVESAAWSYRLPALIWRWTSIGWRYRAAQDAEAAGLAPILAGSLEAFTLLATLGLSPEEAWWRA